LQENNSAVLAVYTNQGSTLPIATAAGNISGHFNGGFWTGKAPPIGYSYFPYPGVIDMETGNVLAKDTDTQFLTTSQIMSAVEQANSD
jgi:hypothetical protein